MNKQSDDKKIKSFFSKNLELNTVVRVSRKQYNSELSAAEKRIAKGKFLLHSVVEKVSEKW